MVEGFEARYQGLTRRQVRRRLGRPYFSMAGRSETKTRAGGGPIIGKQPQTEVWFYRNIPEPGARLSIVFRDGRAHRVHIGRDAESELKGPRER